MGGAWWSAALSCLVMRFMVWRGEAMNTVAKFCPVKYGYARSGEASFGRAGWRKVRLATVWQGLSSSGGVRLRVV